MINLEAIKARAASATAGPWQETWMQIPDIMGYEVSDFGNVRSYYKKGNHKDKRAKYPRTLAKRARRDGAYPSVSLPDGKGSYRTMAIHRLVAMAFIGPRPEGHEVAHLNGDPSDNRLENLAYVTAKENAAHKKLHGTHNSGERNSQSILQDWQVAEIKYLASKSVPQGKIGELFGISHKHVSEILCERTWADEPARTDIPALVERIEELESAKSGDIYPGKMAIIGNHLVVKVDGCTCYGGGPNGHESWCGHEPIQNLAELDGYPDVEGLNAKIEELHKDIDRLRYENEKWSAMAKDAADRRAAPAKTVHPRLVVQDDLVGLIVDIEEADSDAVVRSQSGTIWLISADGFGEYWAQSQSERMLADKLPLPLTVLYRPEV